MIKGSSSFKIIFNLNDVALIEQILQQNMVDELYIVFKPICDRIYDRRSMSKDLERLKEVNDFSDILLDEIKRDRRQS